MKMKALLVGAVVTVMSLAGGSASAAQCDVGVPVKASRIGNTLNYSYSGATNLVDSFSVVVEDRFEPGFYATWVDAEAADGYVFTSFRATSVPSQTTQPVEESYDPPVDTIQAGFVSGDFTQPHATLQTVTLCVAPA